MVIYDKNQKHSLLEFGIEIPISNSTTLKTYQFLLNNQFLKKNIGKWLITDISEKITKDDLLRVHSKEYVEKLYSDKVDDEIIKTFELVDKNGNYNRYNPENAVLPLKSLFQDILGKVAGTYQSLKTALEYGFCFYFAGGMHHAKDSYGEGFCLINDVVIAIRKLQFENIIKKVWIIDIDAHKGDGTASLTYNDDSVITLSIHTAKGWPLDGKEFIDGKPNPSFIPSNIDIPIESGDDFKYNGLLKNGLEKLKDFGMPDLAVVLAGSDPYEKDELPSAFGLKLSLAQMKERDFLVYNFLLSNNIKSAFVMAGGYGESSWEVYTQFLEPVLLDRLKNLK